ncbi:ABC transporter ATP-binding protein [Bradyrhizobium iriomotense]|uniref:ABC transporter ATP-binding protein n=1 Tax=Bradyrhizobium iriomotense TaxID=441950 RepID=A0ABQ6B0U8_9BRAD|nr:ABC transporter ATP-binding protein [Bradyrhizobium iriomotense]GLR87330.1 ABC transporter ATP-binding protein [Bradyrhizobium iriomotense]
MTGDLLLDVASLRKSFGGLTAVDDVTLQVERGSIVSVIGPNGAGKTTFFNLITGIYRPDLGTALLDGVDLVGLRPDQVAAAGLARTFQNIRLFAGMTALENVLVARSMHMRSGYWGALFHTRVYADQERSAVADASELLRFVGLAERADALAGSLAYGEQRRLEIARALATKPKLLLLDEPSAGMNPQETEDAKALILRIRSELGIAVVLIEHDMRLVMTVSDHIVVLDYGRKIAEGGADDIRTHPKVIEAYLGRGVAARTATPESEEAS